MSKTDKDQTGKDGPSKGASSNTDPTYNVRMLMDANFNSLKELMTAEIKHAEKIQELHVTYQEKLTLAEAQRINAIRAVDVEASKVDRERASTQALVLANQVATSAEALRSMVATTAQAAATQYQTAHNALAERLTQLEKAQAIGLGRATVEDPILAALTEKMDKVVTALSESRGKAGLSVPLMMTLAALGGGIVIWVIELLIKNGLP